MTDYVLKDHKPSVRQDEARLRGLYRIIFFQRPYACGYWNAKPAAAIGMQSPPARARVVRLTSGGETPPQVRAPPARTPAETLQPPKGFHALRKGFSPHHARRRTLAGCFARRPKFISVAVWGAQFWERSTSYGNCYTSTMPNEPCGAKSLGQARRSPPARMRADYFFKDHSCRSTLASDPGTIFGDRAFICMTTGSSA